MKRTTILADDELLLEVKKLAEEANKTTTAVIHEALAEYVARHRPRRKSISFIGLGHSGHTDTSERAEDILAAEIDPATGWSH